MVQATVGAWAMTGCRTLLLGGDHSLTLGALRALAQQLRDDLAAVGQGPAYLSLDLDALDPVLVPAVAEPVPGGLNLDEAMALIHAARLWPEPWVGADLMELAPTLEGAEASARVAVHLALHLLA